MEAWQTLLLAFGGNAVLLAVLGWLGKSLLEKLILRDTKTFEYSLQLKSQNEIERLRSEMLRSVESYKAQLKKSEFLFQKELETVSTFSSLFHSLLPKYSIPDMDSDNALNDLASNFKFIEDNLRQFQIKHSVMLNDQERKLLSVAIYNAAQGKFEIDHENYDDVGKLAKNRADAVLQTLSDLESKLIVRVRSQGSL